MVYPPLPPLPPVGGPWLDLGHAQYSTLAQLITDLPKIKSDATAVTSAVAALTATKAPTANPAFTGTVTGITKAMVGLGNVDNTSDAAKRYSAAQITAGTLDPARLPTAVAAIRRRTVLNEQTPTATNWAPRPVGYGTVVAVGAPPAPADADPTDLHISGAGIATTVAATVFDGSNGTPWPAPWVTAKMPTAGRIEQWDGRGHITTGNSLGGYSSVDAAAVRHANQAANIEVAFTLRRVTADIWPRFVLRCDTASLDPATGLSIMLAGTTATLTEVRAWTYVNVAEATVMWEQAVDYRVRVSAQGAAIRVKVWKASTTEPQAWTIDATTTLMDSGYWGFVSAIGSKVENQTAAFDDITIS